MATGEYTKSPTRFTIRSRLLDRIPSLRYGFGTIAEPRTLLGLPDLTQKLKWRQVHGARVAEVNEPNEDLGETDGLYTKKSVPLEVVTADCLPILLARKEGDAVAALHGGWRGVYGGILGTFGKLLAEKQEDPADWIAVIGPSNRACCYEVGEDLIANFAERFPSLSIAEIAPSFRKLDLARIAERTLNSIGIREVEVLPFCTFCHRLEDGSPTFHSYRRGNDGARLYSLIQIAHSKIGT